MGILAQQYFGKALKKVNVSDIQKLIDENVIENYTLDYTEIPRNPSWHELAKEISAFLNTNGGLDIFGVSEKDHRFPVNITWTTIPKETIVRNLRNLVVPWHDGIEFQIVKNPDEENQAIYIIETPKSKNPPHMGGNSYYIRNVYESIPMSHYDVESKFRYGYLNKEKIVDHIIGPILNYVDEIYSNLTYDYVYDEKFIKDINTNYRYLLLQTDEGFYSIIDGLFNLIKETNLLTNNYRYIINKIIKNTVINFFPSLDWDLANLMDYILGYRRNVINIIYNESTTYADIPIMLLYDLTPDETIQKTQHVKSIMGEPEFSLFPIDQQHKKIINEPDFYKIINDCKIEVSNNQDITKLKMNVKIIENMCLNIMDMCFKEM